MEISSHFELTSKNRDTALVIDDDRDTVSVLSDFLEIKGIRVIGKGFDGLEAVELYKKLRPDVVFLDVMMHKFDGLFALKKIREIQKDSIVVMVTADLSEKTTKQLSQLCASDIIYKPYNISEIMDLLNKFMRLRN